MIQFSLKNSILRIYGLSIWVAPLSTILPGMKPLSTSHRWL